MWALLELTKITLRCSNVFYSHHLLRNIHFACKVKYSKTSLDNPYKGFHSSYILLKVSKDVAKEKSTENNPNKDEKKKKEKLTYITLIAPNKHVTVMTLEDANKLAVRRDLKLIKVRDTQKYLKKDRPMYQLMTTAQYLLEEKKDSVDSSKSKSFIKGTKLMSVSSKINDHDLIAKVNNVLKWLEKLNEVKVAISNDNGEAENVYNKIADKINGTGKLVQKRGKGFEIRFQILPLKQDTTSKDKVES